MIEIEIDIFPKEQKDQEHAKILEQIIRLDYMSRLRDVLKNETNSIISEIREDARTKEIISLLNNNKTKDK